MITIRVFDFATPEYDESVRLRDDILRKPLNLSFKAEDLATEYNSHHLGVFNQQNRMIGCLVLKPLSEELYKMRQVAVAENCQGKGVGKAMVKASEEYVLQLGGKKFELNARDVAIPFYESLKYKKVGEEFTEVGIKHFKMEKILLK